MTPQQADLMDIQAQDINEVLRRWNAHEKLVNALKLYHFDSKEHGGQTDYQSPATKLLRELGEL